jgi:hypothetical protein
MGGDRGSDQNDVKSEWMDLRQKGVNFPDNIFDDPSKYPEQLLIDAIIEATIYEEAERNSLRHDPLVRLLIQNPPGTYNFVIISAAGVITEGMSIDERKEKMLKITLTRAYVLSSFR